MRTGPLPRVPIRIVADADDAHVAVGVPVASVEWVRDNVSALVCSEKDVVARFVKWLSG